MRKQFLWPRYRSVPVRYQYRSAEIAVLCWYFSTPIYLCSGLILFVSFGHVPVPHWYSLSWAEEAGRPRRKPILGT